MAQVNGSDATLVELTDSVVMALQALRDAQTNYAATVRGTAIAAGDASVITSWSETNTNGGTLNVTLAIPVSISASADGYSVSADVSFDDGL